MFSFKDICVVFGGNEVLKNISLTLNRGDRLGLCGTNGSGKSTFINVATGFQRPSSGEILLFGKSLVGEKPWLFSRQGVSRTFQSSRVIDSVVLREQIGVSKETLRRGLEMVEGTLLMEFVDFFASEVPLSVLRQFEMVRALAMQPKILFLDEPSAGLTNDEVEVLAEFLLERLDKDCCLMVVEHRYKFMKRVVSSVYELQQGNMVAIDKVGA